MRVRKDRREGNNQNDEDRGGWIFSVWQPTPQDPFNVNNSLSVIHCQSRQSQDKNSKNIDEQSRPSTTTKPEPERIYSNSVEVEYPNEYTNDEQSECPVIMEDDDDIVSYDNPEMLYDETSFAEADESLAKSFIDDNMLVENGMFACKECGKVFSKKQVLKNHIEIHMDKKHECTICHKTFKTSNSLYSHRSHRHKN